MKNAIVPAKAQFRRRTFHEPNLIQIMAGPNHENPAFWFRRRTYLAELNSLDAKEIEMSVLIR